MPTYTFINRYGDKVIVNNIDLLEWRCLEASNDKKTDTFPKNTWCRVKSYYFGIWDDLKLLY